MSEDITKGEEEEGKAVELKEMNSENAAHVSEEGEESTKSSMTSDGSMAEGSEDGEEMVSEQKETKIEYKNGDTYTGEIDVKTEKRHGQGKYVFANSDAYFEGTYDMDKRVHGTVFYGATRGMYTGDFKDGKREGQGKYNYANGDVYEGSWCGNQRHGLGKYTCAGTASTLTTTWHKGHPKSGAEGCWTYSDGRTCEGTLDDNAKVVGTCVFKNAEGKVVATGSFENGAWKSNPHGVPSVAASATKPAGSAIMSSASSSSSSGQSLSGTSSNSGENASEKDALVVKS